MAKPRKKAAAANSEPDVLYMKEVPGKTRGEILAADMVRGDSWSGVVAVSFSRGSYGEDLPLTESIKALQDEIAKVQAGDLAQVEAMLFGQATALATIFHECARRSAANMGHHPEVMERYMRLALKAQSQCRTTLEALVEAKQPKAVAFVRQANIAQGHQQVVNEGSGTCTHAPAREEPETRPNELLEGSNVTRLDAGAARSPIGSHPPLEAVGAVHGAKVA